MRSGRSKKPEPPLSPSRVIIHAVTVVPMLAPMMTATALLSESKPALTKLTTITVVAEEDWMAVVTAVPVRMLLSGFPVILPMTALIRLPATF